MGQAGGGPSPRQHAGMSEHDKLQHQRINEIKKKAANMKGSLANNGRCPVCTLKPPCKHYASIDALNGGGGQQQQQDNTPNKNMEFYPNKKSSEYSNSEVTQSDNKYQRSDGFSITSHNNNN